MLLQWMVLEPSGGLSAIRFSSPVRVKSLRIFPTGAHPFKQDDIVAITEPSSLYLDVFFNAHPVAVDGQQKVKPSNALVPTSIAYQGGEVDFLVDMGTEFATRLMIIRGKFEKLSLAVYGEIVSEAPEAAMSYQPKKLLHVSQNALPLHLNPAYSVDPTQLAQSLLTLIPDSPSLPLIVRLMFCLKPSNDDWDEPGFPHLYTDLDNELDDLNLERAADITSKSVSDDVDDSVLRRFASHLGDSIEEYNDDNAYFLAKVLSQSAPQHPSLGKYILENVDLARMFTVPNLDRPTLLYLLDASASLDVSRHLNDSAILDALQSIQFEPLAEAGARRAASRLYDRIRGWEVLEESLSNTQSPFPDAASMIKDVAMEENSFGILLENMILNRDILDKLLDTPTPAQPLQHLPSMNRKGDIHSHDDFIAFLRAFVGVAAVVAVYAWSDSVPVERCRERTLTVLRLWQNIDGYKDIVNHLLLMRQMTYRLECMLPMEDDLPSQAGIDAEHILKVIAAQPSSMLRVDFAKVMQNLQAPLNYITDDEVGEIKRASAVAKDGLLGAVSLLTKDPEQLLPTERKLDLRIAIAIIMDVLRRQEDGEQSVLDAVWRLGCSNLHMNLVLHLSSSASELRKMFALTVPPCSSQADVTAIFELCDELSILLTSQLQAHILHGFHTSALTRAIADIFICSDSADMVYSQESAVCAVAHTVRQTCVALFTSIVIPFDADNAFHPSSIGAFICLLDYANAPGDHDAGHHITQIFWLLDQTLPFYESPLWGDESYGRRISWLRHIVPPILSKLRSFYRSLERDNRAHLIKRFLDLDDGVTGIADWLMLEEQEILSEALSLLRTCTEIPRQHIGNWKICDSLRVLLNLIQSSSRSAKWAINLLTDQGENARQFETNLRGSMNLDIHFVLLRDVAQLLVPHLDDSQIGLRSAVLSELFRSARCGRVESFRMALEIFHISNEPILDEQATEELGAVLKEIANRFRSGSILPEELAGQVFRVLDAASPMDNSHSALVLRGLRQESLNDIYQWLSTAESVSVAEKTKLEAMRLRWTVAGQPKEPLTEIPSDYHVELALDKWEELLALPVPVPSTPKRRSPAQSAEMLGMITVSPPNSLLRSPEVKGLTKTYANNDFRQLRQLSASRQNTSRLPSMHVDDFEQGSPIVPLSLSSSPPAPMPPLTFVSPQRPMNIDPMLPLNPNTYYQQ